MPHEVVMTIDKGSDVQPYVLDYERVDVCRTEQGQWVYVGYQGPLSRYVYMGDAGSFSRRKGPDLFFVPGAEIKKLFRECGYEDLIQKYFTLDRKE